MATATISKTAAIREIAEQQPDWTAAQIAKVLAGRGIKVHVNMVHTVRSQMRKAGGIGIGKANGNGAKRKGNGAWANGNDWGNGVTTSATITTLATFKQIAGEARELVQRLDPMLAVLSK